MHPPHLGWSLLASASTLLACSGAIDDSGGDRRGGSVLPPPGAGAPATVDPAAMAAANAADEAMRSQDPALFQLASKYFPGTSPLGGAVRLSRLTRTQLDRTTAALLPDAHAERAEDALPRDPLQTNYEFAANLSWNAANFTPFTSWVTAMTERVRGAPTMVIDCSAEGNAPGCLETQARRFVQRAFRGVTREEQLARFASFFSASVAEVGLETAVADLVDVTLTSPAYVFREEIATDANGVLLPPQQLQHLTYTLADAPPEALGLAYDQAPALVGTPDALASTVTRVLATPQARDKLVRFFLAWLEVKDPAEFAIATNVFPEWTPELAAAAVDETRRFLEDRLASAAPRLTDLTQATESFVSSALATIYGADQARDGVLSPLDPAERLGIFTQPAVLASHSGPTNSRLVKRGVFFTRKVMCLPLGAPPEGVNTMIPETPNATERQRVESITSGQPCIGCHAFINPFGFMQESWDAIGRFRSVDEHGLPIDPAIAVDFLDEGPLATRTGVEALRSFTGSARFKQCFARQLFRNYMGRDEEAGDDPTLRQMFFGFAQNDAQDIVGMLTRLSGSTSFGQRSGAP
jgi:hypothetical protein